MKIWIYRLLFLPLLLIALPYYGYRMLRRGGYGKDFRQRFGYFPILPPKNSQRRRLWFHVVSVGEAQSLRPLLEKFRHDFRYEIVITTTTSTGYGILRKLYGNMAVVGLFPLDFVEFSRRAWNRICPDLMLLTDSELWPEHLHQAKKRRVPVILINARLSDRSFRRYLKFRGLAKWLWNSLSEILVSSEETAARLAQLGIDSGKVRFCGNLKCDRPKMPPLDFDERQRLLKSLGFAAEKNGELTPILFGCSTWPGEEQLLLEIFRQLEKRDSRWRLILAPRHGERRGEIRQLLQREKIPHWFRSEGDASANDIRVAVIDSAGELASLIRLGTLAFVGKSLPPHRGGQSPLDAVAAEVPLVAGSEMGNFREICQQLFEAKALRRGHNAHGVCEALKELASDSFQRNAMARAATDWLEESRGAVSRIHERLEFWSHWPVEL